MYFQGKVSFIKNFVYPASILYKFYMITTEKLIRATSVSNFQLLHIEDVDYINSR